jgi:hypothetical protein
VCKTRACVLGICCSVPGCVLLYCCLFVVDCPEFLYCYVFVALRMFHSALFIRCFVNVIVSVSCVLFICCSVPGCVLLYCCLLFPYVTVLSFCIVIYLLFCYVIVSVSCVLFQLCTKPQWCAVNSDAVLMASWDMVRWIQ